MQTALILMTILGCDDTATQCHYVEMLDERWATIQSCDAGAEDNLKTYSNIDYPVVVAVCQTPEDAGLAEVEGEPAELLDTQVSGAATVPAVLDELLPKADIPPAKPAANPDPANSAGAVPDPGLSARVLSRVKDVLPEAASLKSLISEPVHFVTDSYSWVAQRFDK